MLKFEYKVEIDLEDAELNELGEQGWELVSVVDHHSIETGAQLLFYFKRTSTKVDTIDEIVVMEQPSSLPPLPAKEQ